MSFSYLTISKPVTDIQFKEKGSRFLGYAYPVETEEEAKKLIARLWELHPSATHVCYAWRLGLEGEQYRVNDDGEPSGTAGLPIYNQILSKEITFVLVASVRYYGGTKLGVGGLIRAYKHSAQITLEEAKLTEKFLTRKVRFDFAYEDQGNVMRLIDKFEAEVLETVFELDCSVTVKIKEEQLDSFVGAFEPYYQVKVEILPD